MGIFSDFAIFHTKHPEVYINLVKLARDLKARGHAKGGIGMLWEVLRWQWFMTRDADEDFKLNNNYRSHYARFIMDNEADLKGFFDLRELRAA